MFIKNNKKTQLLLLLAIFGSTTLQASNMSWEDRQEAARKQLKMHTDLNKESGYADANSSQAINRKHNNQMDNVRKMESACMSDWREGDRSRNYETGFLGDMKALAYIEKAQNTAINKAGNQAKHEFPGKKGR